MRALGAGVFLGLAIALFPVQAALDARRPARAETLLYLPDKRLLKVLACGHGPTVADLSWVRSTGYILEEFKFGTAHIAYLYELFDAMTELDPNYVEAYEAGAIFLASVAQRPEAAVKLLEKGLGKLKDDGVRATFDPAGPRGRVHPRHSRLWKLGFMLGSIHLVSFAGVAETGDEREAEIREAGRIFVWTAETFGTSSPEARELERIGAALSRRKLSDYERALWERTIWNARAQGTGAVAEVAKRRLAEADSELDRCKLEAALRASVARNGRPPSRLDELATPDGRYAGLTRIPDDPLGVGYRLEDGRVRARGVEAARVRRRLERRIGAYRSSHGRPPARLDELVPSVSAPPDIEVTYDPATGAVSATPR